MSLSSQAFQYRRLVFSLIGGLMIYGFYSYFTLSAREDPKITIREAVITTAHPGLPPEMVEKLITKTLEEAVMEMPEIEEIRSSSLTGLSIIHAEAYDTYFDLGQVWDDLRQKIDGVRDQLPEGTYPPQVNDSFGDVAVVTAAVTAPGYQLSEMLDIAQHTRDLLYSVRGTEKVELLGVPEERVYLEYEPGKLAAAGLTPGLLAQELRGRNILPAAGNILVGEKQWALAPSGDFKNLDEIRTTLINLPGGEGTVPLNDLVTVQRGYADPPQRLAYYNGEPAVILSITLKDTANVLAFSPRIKEKIEEIRQGLPVGFHLDIATYQAEQVANAVYGVTSNVIQTLAIVLGVVILFLGLRTGLIVGAIVPTVMLVTLAVMQFTGISLERMSLATLIISLGLLVDNGIVIAEDFLTRLEEGVERADALAQSGRELAIPLLTSSLTTILVFMPLMLADHVAGEFTRNISIVICYTLTISWFVALTVTPVLCYFFAKPSEKGENKKRSISDRLFDWMTKFYKRELTRIMNYRFMFGLLMVGLFVLGVLGMALVKKEFFPGSDRTQLLVYIDLPPDASASETDRKMREIFAFLNGADAPEHIDSYAGYVGFGGPRFVLSLTPIDPAPNKGFMVLNIDKVKNIDPTMEALREALNSRFPGIRNRVTRMFLGPSDSAVIEIQVKGPDENVLFDTAEKVAGILHARNGTLDIRNDWEGRVPRLRIDLKQSAAVRAGISSSDIARDVSGVFSGHVVSHLRDGDELQPIVLRAVESSRSQLDRLAGTMIFPSGGGRPVPLEQVAEIRMVNDFARRERENLVRTITVFGKNINVVAETLVPLIEEDLKALEAELPPNHYIEFDGVVAMSVEAQKALSAYLPMCIGLIFVVLMGQFNSFRRSLIIMITLPLLIIGAVLGLMVGQAPFGFMVSLGLYSLAGILANNAIVLIDRIDLELLEEPDAEPWQLVIRASVRRLRPILMSTGTTILGLLPLILSRDVLFYGMALAIGGGLLVGTILTLGLVPVLYSVFFRIPKPKSEGGKASGVSPVLATTLLLILFTNACMVGPEYRKPETKVQETWEAGETLPADQEPFRTERWYTEFFDPVLNEMVSHAMLYNPKVEIAWANLRRARAEARVVAPGLYPRVGVGGSVQRSEMSENSLFGQFPGAGGTHTTYSVGFDMNWEIDLWGKQRRRIEAAQAQVEAVTYTEADVLISVIAEVVRQYALYRGYLLQINDLQRDLALLEQSANSVQRLFDAGLADQTAVTRMEAQLAATRAQLPSLRAEAAASKQALSVLCGIESSQLEMSMAGMERERPPRVPQFRGLGLRSDILRRRPDIRAAERQLAAATAGVGIATADLYPSFNLAASLGLESLSTGNLLDASSRTWSIVPGIRFPLFDRSRLHALVDVEKAKAEVAYIRYKETVLTALAEVETAAVRYVEQERVIAELDKALRQQNQTLTRVQRRFDAGEDDILDLITAQRDLLSLRTQLTQARTGHAVAAAALYKALGGGWKDEQSVSEKEKSEP